jgi:ATP-dependent Clp endopeptidase proteolytic subunit ClpP
MKIFIDRKKLDELDEEDDDAQQAQSLLGSLSLLQRDSDVRSIGLFGSIDALKTAQLIGAILDLSERESPDEDEDKEAAPITGDNLESSDSTDDSSSESAEESRKIDPIEFMINTPGGEADEMFALYDIMRMVKNKCDIETFGIGKVMSAGVLILAAGTKGKRRIGKNCRVMIHNVMAGSVGSLHNLENEIKEIKFIQQSYLRALSEESGMSIKKLQRLLDRKVNVYLSAEEAVQFGIADIIV